MIHSQWEYARGVSEVHSVPSHYFLNIKSQRFCHQIHSIILLMDGDPYT